MYAKNHIRDYRKREKLTLQDVSDKLASLAEIYGRPEIAISYVQVGRHEKGESQVSLDQLELYAKILNTTVINLINGPTASNEIIEQTIQLLSGLSEPDQKFYADNLRRSIERDLELKGYTYWHHSPSPEKMIKPTPNSNLEPEDKKKDLK